MERAKGQHSPQFVVTDFSLGRQGFTGSCNFAPGGREEQRRSPHMIEDRKIAIVYAIRPCACSTICTSG